MATKAKAKFKSRIGTGALPAHIAARIKFGISNKTRKDDASSEEKIEQIHDEEDELDSLPVLDLSANNLLLLELGVRKQYELAIRYFYKILGSGDSRASDVETFEIVVDVYCTKTKAPSDDRQLRDIVQTMLEKNYLRSPKVLTKVLKRFLDSQNTAALRMIFEELRRPEFDALGSLLDSAIMNSLLSVAVANSDPLCCASIYGFMLKHGEEPHEQMKVMLAELWENHL